MLLQNPSASRLLSITMFLFSSGRFTSSRKGLVAGVLHLAAHSSLSAAGLAQTPSADPVSKAGIVWPETDRQTHSIEPFDAYDEGQHKASRARFFATWPRRYPKNYEVNEALGSLYAEAGDLTRMRSRSLIFVSSVFHRPQPSLLLSANLGAVVPEACLNRPDAVQRTRIVKQKLLIRLKLWPDPGTTSAKPWMLTEEAPASAAKAFAAASALSSRRHLRS